MAIVLEGEMQGFVEWFRNQPLPTHLISQCLITEHLNLGMGSTDVTRTDIENSVCAIAEWQELIHTCSSSDLTLH